MRMIHEQLSESPSYSSYSDSFSLLAAYNLQEEAQDQGPAMCASSGRALDVREYIGVTRRTLHTRRFTANGHHICRRRGLNDHLWPAGLVRLCWLVSLMVAHDIVGCRFSFGMK